MTISNLESLASVRAKLNDAIINSGNALVRLDNVDVSLALLDDRVTDLEALGGGGAATWGTITGTLSSQTDLQLALDAKQPAGSYAAASHTHPWSNITSTPTTLAGYGITDAATAAQGSLADSALQPGDTIPWTDVTGKPSFATVATTGSYADLAGIPSSFTPSAHTHTLSNISDVTITVANLNSLDDGVNTTLHFHDADRNRANHTGTQLSSTISDFNEAAQDAVGGMVDSSLVYNDATPALQRAALTGAVTASAGSNTTSLGSFTKAQLDTAVSDGNVMYVGDAPTAHTHTLANITDVTMTVANLNSLDDGLNTTLHFHDADRNRANHTGTQTASTISDFSEAVDDRVAALVVGGTNMTITYNDVANTLTFDAAGGGAGTNLSYTAATRIIASDTGTDATLPLFTSADAGLTPASGGGTTNFLRADGTWAAPSGGGGGGAPQALIWVI